jgi:hypothetical protein
LILTQALLGAAVMACPQCSLTIGHWSCSTAGPYLKIVKRRIEDLIGLCGVASLRLTAEVMALFPLGLAAAKTYAPSGDLEGAKPSARQLWKWLWLPASP